MKQTEQLPLKCSHSRYLTDPFTLTLLHSERTKLYTILTVLSAIGLKGYCTVFQHALKLLEITGNVLS